MEPARRFHRRTPRWCWLVMLAAAALILPGRELVIGQAAETPKADDKEVASTTTEPPPSLTLRRVWTGDTRSEHPYEVSFDGKYLAYINWRTGDVWIYDFTTGERHNLTKASRDENSYHSASALTISPNSKWIAYALNVGGDVGHELRVISLEGGEPRVLMKDSDLLESVTWSLDGKEILVLWQGRNRNNQIVWISVADGSIRLVKDVGERWLGNACASPDGRYIVYDLRETEDHYTTQNIFILDTEEKDEVPLLQDTTDADWSDEKIFGWSLDGNWILFRSDRSGIPDAWLMRVSDGRPQGNPRLVKKHVDRMHRRGFTWDGSFYYAEWADTLEGIHVARLDFQKGGPLSWPITRVQPSEMGNVSWPAWSNDGRLLIYTRRNRLLIHSLEEQKVRKLTDVPDFTRRPRWSADDKTIFCGHYRIDVETGQAHPLIGEGRMDSSWRSDYLGCSVSLDGKRVFARENESNTKRKRIALYDSKSETVKELYSDPNLMRDVTLSPDGQWLLFSTYDSRAESSLLRIMRSAGGTSRRLMTLDGIEWYDWHPNSKDVVFVTYDDQGSTFWKITIEGGSPQKVWQTPTYVESFHIHPDGQHIVFDAVGEGVAEVWAMENFLPPE